MAKASRLDLADSALHAPAAGFADQEFYPDIVDKAAVLTCRLAWNHPLPDGNEVAQVAFEIARRHRFATVMESLPPGVTVHVLPTGAAAPVAMGLRSNLRYRDLSGIPERIERASTASRAYLSELSLPLTGPG